jgi:hypothetical protein
MIEKGRVLADDEHAVYGMLVGGTRTACVAVRVRMMIHVDLPFFLNRHDLAVYAIGGSASVTILSNDPG